MEFLQKLFLTRSVLIELGLIEKKQFFVKKIRLKFVSSVFALGDPIGDLKGRISKLFVQLKWNWNFYDETSLTKPVFIKLKQSDPVSLAFEVERETYTQSEKFYWINLRNLFFSISIKFGFWLIFLYEWAFAFSWLNPHENILENNLFLLKSDPYF